MSSRPDSLGKPRSTTAMSSGYSLPANRPSSPSEATSTVNPCRASCSRRPSRRAASSSTTSALICLTHPSGGGVDTHGEYAAVSGQQLQHVDLAAILVLDVRAHHARVVLAFGAAYGFVE